MNTIENNKLIAEFMGFKNYMSDVQQETRMINERDYHLSWDWLMPVVEKIESIGFSTQTNTIGRQHQITQFEIFSGGALVLSVRSKSKKEATYKAVVEFIKWYNDNK